MTKAHLKFYQGLALHYGHTATAPAQIGGPLTFFNPEKLGNGVHSFLSLAAYMQQISLCTKFKNLFGLSAQATPQTPGFNLVLQVSRNKLMHALHGNTVSTLLLDYLVPMPTPIQISREVLLRSRLPPPPGLTPQPLLPITISTTPPSVEHSDTVISRNKRTGRRRRRVDDKGVSHFFKTRKSRFFRNQRSRIQRNLQNSSYTADASISASERHAGSPFRANEERPRHRGGVNGTLLGASKRRNCRRAYRRWRRETKQHVPAGADTLLATPPLSTKVTQNNTTRFRREIAWQEHIERKKKPTRERIRTTPPLAYSYELRVAAQNVQGLADTLKLKNLIHMMTEHNLDVVILTETKSTAYYSYTSEQHLVIQSGNHKDKYAGVGAIIHPKITPYLADVTQVSNRLIHLTFNKKRWQDKCLRCLCSTLRPGP